MNLAARLAPLSPAPMVLDPLLEDDQWWWLRDPPQLAAQRATPQFRMQEQRRRLEGDICFALYTAAYIWGGPRPVRQYAIKLSREVDNTYPVISIGLQDGDIEMIGDSWVTSPARTIIDLILYNDPDLGQRVVDMRDHLDTAHVVSQLEKRPIPLAQRQEVIALVRAVAS